MQNSAVTFLAYSFWDSFGWRGRNSLIANVVSSDVRFINRTEPPAPEPRMRPTLPYFLNPSSAKGMFFSETDEPSRLSMPPPTMFWLNSVRLWVLLPERIAERFVELWWWSFLGLPPLKKRLSSSMEPWLFEFFEGEGEVVSVSYSDLCLENKELEV